MAKQIKRLGYTGEGGIYAGARAETYGPEGKVFEVYDPPPEMPKAPAQSQPSQRNVGMIDYYEGKEVPSLVKERMKFEQYLIEKNNVPVGVNRQIISQEVNKRSVAQEESLFERLFGGQYRFEDRNELGPQQMSDWQTAKLQHRKAIEVAIDKDIDKTLTKHKDMMAIWDDTIGKKKEPKELSGQNWILPDRTSVISYDGGRTYKDATGQESGMPSNAIKVPSSATLSEMNMNQAKMQAQSELKSEQLTGGQSPEKAALAGTGPYARTMSAFEATAGGLGLDKLIGTEGLWPEIADAKQYLRNIKQMGKAALLNSARGATWEQEKIEQLFPNPDTMFTNPRIEARKFKNLTSVLKNEKKFNNQAIVSAITPKEIAKYRTSNNEIDRLFALIAKPEGMFGLTSDDDALINKYLGK